MLVAPPKKKLRCVVARAFSGVVKSMPGCEAEVFSGNIFSIALTCVASRALLFFSPQDTVFPEALKTLKEADPVVYDIVQKEKMRQL